MSDLNQAFAPFLQGHFIEKKASKSIVFNQISKENLNTNSTLRSKKSISSNSKEQFLASFDNFSYDLFIKAVFDHSKSRLAQLTPASRRRKLSSLKLFSAWCLEQNLLTSDPLRSAPSAKLPERLPEYLNLEEVLSYFKSITQDFELQPHKYKNELLLFLVLYGCGLRIEEACRIRVETIDWSNSRITIIGKRNKQRFAILPEFIKSRLMKLVNTSDTFIYGSKALIPRTAYNWIRKRGLKAGLHKPVHPHMFRHTYATHLLREKTDLRHLQELLGHASLTATQRYTHLDKDQLLQSLESFHPLSKNE